ncbi:MAG: Crp/Fnr family transcriptional regulator [Armatimonadetes bacterium]|nr:Crp/Fnr family transcriptional regulator [Armatimonadota bacterium]
MATPVERTTIEEQLRKIQLFAGLEEESLKLLAARCRRRKFGAGEALFHEGDPGQTLYIVLSGCVIIQRVTKTMETVHIAERGAGEHFGELALFDDKPRSADAETGTACELLLLDGRYLRQFLEAHPSVAWNIIRALSARLRENSDQAVRSNALDVTGRLAGFLCDQCLPLKPDPVTKAYLLPRLTDEQIATRINTSRESVNRRLAHLKAMRLISRDGRAIVVTNLPKLKALCSVSLP